MLNLFTLGVLWNVRTIFINIEKKETPFIRKNCRSVFNIGVIIIALSIVKDSILPLVCKIIGIGSLNSGSLVSFNLNSLIIGGVIICQSYIFEYGTALQKESDETL